MRGWGIVFVISAAACVVLAEIEVALAFIYLSVVCLAALLAGTRAWADYRERVERASAAETAEHREWTDEIKQMDDAAWEQIVAAVDMPVPLIYPGGLRHVEARIPRPRRPIEGS